AAPRWGLPQRRSAAPTPTSWELIVGAVRAGDATGLLPDPDAEAGGPPPTAMPARARPEQ
ncbi:MAG: hypothetical protein M3Q10_10055, partial [Chloroflexota bacterium]|nr:hypothetical protein [Chloroflexota bacterium]